MRKNNRWLPFLLLPLLALTTFADVADAKKRKGKSNDRAGTPTVVVAPFVTSTAGEEYAWIGSAFSEALTDRLLTTGEAHVFSQKQWAAVLRERDIAAQTVRAQSDAEAIARQLGADQYIFGRYKASWPEITVNIGRYEVGKKEPLAEAAVTGTLQKLLAVEKDVAKAVFSKTFRKSAKAKGPAKTVNAWRSLTLCRDTLALQSIGPRARVWLPQALAEQALGHCERALKEDKKNVIAKSFQALGLFIVGQEKKASKNIRKVVKGKKRPYGWPDQIAFFILKRTGDEKKALKVLQGAIKKRAGLLHARTTLGEYLAAKGDLAGAQNAFEASLAVAPRQPWVLVQVGKLKSKQGDIDGALADTDKALALVPGDPVILMEKASRFIDGKRWQEAEVTLRETMASDPRLAAAYLRLGYVYLETNQVALAGPILQKALYEADRESEKRIKGYAHYDLAKLHGRLGDPDRAMTEVSRAVKAGFNEQARFESDPDLKDVVSSPAYKRLFPTPAPKATPTPQSKRSEKDARAKATKEAAAEKGSGTSESKAVDGTKAASTSSAEANKDATSSSGTDGAKRKPVAPGAKRAEVKKLKLPVDNQKAAKKAGAKSKSKKGKKGKRKSKAEN